MKRIPKIILLIIAGLILSCGKKSEPPEEPPKKDDKKQSSISLKDSLFRYPEGVRGDQKIDLNLSLHQTDSVLLSLLTNSSIPSSSGSSTGMSVNSYLEIASVIKKQRDKAMLRLQIKYEVIKMINEQFSHSTVTEESILSNLHISTGEICGDLEQILIRHKPNGRLDQSRDCTPLITVKNCIDVIFKKI